MHANHARGAAHYRFKGYPRNTFGPLYQAWQNMLSRCRPNHVRHRDYHDRGIFVTAAWKDFATFAADMGPHPGKGWSVDRIDNAGGYHSGNCRWANAHVQANNARKRSSFPKRNKLGVYTT
jgi:hypothetical protein